MFDADYKNGLEVDPPPLKMDNIYPVEQPHRLAAVFLDSSLSCDHT